MANTTHTMLTVTSPDYKDMLPQVLLTVACSEGGYSMKRGYREDKLAGSAIRGNSYSGGQELLPMPNPSDKSEENRKRYAMYKERAVVVEMTKRTKESLVGAATRKNNIVELPASIDYLEENVDNAGLTLESQYKQTLETGMDQGTLGLFVDIPSSGSASAADIANGVRANIKLYDFINILCPAYSVIDNKEVLSYLLLRECVTVRKDLTVESEYQYRKLELIEGFYVHTLLDDTFAVKEDPITPTDAGGNKLKEIPFYPIGAQNNTLKRLDPPLLLGIAELNVGQYRNSADVEENAYMSSQSTNFVFVEDGGTFKENNPEGLLLGAGAVNTLGENDKFEMHQAKESNLSNTLQLEKIKAAISMGAQLIMEGGPQETAEAVRTKSAASSASLSSLSDNSEMAYVKAISMCEQLMSRTVSEIVFTVNKDFIDTSLTPEQVKNWLEISVLGKASDEMFVTAMVKGGIFPEGTKAEDIRGSVEVTGD